MRGSAGRVRASAAMVVATFVSATAAAAVSISVGSATGAPGMAVTVQGILTSGGAQVGGVQHAIAFDPATPIASCTLNPALAALSRWGLQPQGCTPLVDCTQASFVIVSFGSAIPDGPLYQCEVRIAPTAPAGRYPLTISGARASDPQGQVLSVEATGGQVEVVPPTPTAPPSPTAAPWWGDGGCQVDTTSRVGNGWYWLAAGIVLVLRQRVPRANRTTSE